MKKTSIQLLVGLLPLLSGCAITMQMPVARMDSPEVQGELGKGYVGGGLAIANKLTIIPDVTASPPQTASPSFDPSLVVPIKGGLGLWERMDLDFQVVSSSPALGRVKIQLLGEPRQEAKQGNFSLSLTAGGGLGGRNDRDTNTILTNVTANYTIDYYAWDVAMILGYRAGERFLIYGGPFFTHYYFRGTIDQTINNTVQPQRLFSGHATQGGLNAGAHWEFGRFFELKGEAAVGVADVRYTGNAAPSLAVYAGFHW